MDVGKLILDLDGEIITAAVAHRHAINVRETHIPYFHAECIRGIMRNIIAAQNDGYTSVDIFGWFNTFVINKRCCRNDGQSPVEHKFAAECIKYTLTHQLLGYKVKVNLAKSKFIIKW